MICISFPGAPAGADRRSKRSAISRSDMDMIERGRAADEGKLRLRLRYPLGKSGRAFAPAWVHEFLKSDTPCYLTAEGLDFLILSN